MMTVLKVLGVGLLGATVGGFGFALARPLLGIPFHRRRSNVPNARVARSGLFGRTAPDPMATLVANLHRRFSDARDVDFGFHRVARAKSRLHLGPVMERNDLVWYDGDGRGSDGFDPRFARKRGESYDLKTETGTWISYDDARPQMRPETPDERGAIARLLKDRREIAIYTFGAFDTAGRSLRRNGPAYLRQLGPKAPEADRLAPVAEAVWRGASPTVSGDVLPGYVIRTAPIFSERACVDCHNDRNGSEEETGSAKARYKPGDRLGLLVITEKLR